MINLNIDLLGRVSVDADDIIFIPLTKYQRRLLFDALKDIKVKGHDTKRLVECIVNMCHKENTNAS